MSAPVCIEFVFSNVSFVSTNIHTAKLIITPQVYNSGGSLYNGADVAQNMWVLDAKNGNTFKITNISEQTADYVDVTIEDVDGYNSLKSGLPNGGSPNNGLVGYIFQLNTQGVPILANLPHIASAYIFASQQSRFMSTQLLIQGPTGATGPAGPVAGTTTQVIFNNSGIAAGSSNMTFATDTGTLTVSGLTTTGIRVAIGQNAGFSSQGAYSVAVGLSAGNVLQSESGVAVGQNAGGIEQRTAGIAIGAFAGYHDQGAGGTGGLGNSIAIGAHAGWETQGQNSIAIGHEAGKDIQEQGSIAIGYRAGFDNNAMKEYAIAIGAYAGQSNASNNSIVLNATGSPLNSTEGSLFIKPVVPNLDSSEFLYYNSSSGLVSYGGVTSLTIPSLATSSVTTIDGDEINIDNSFYGKSITLDYKSITFSSSLGATCEYGFQTNSNGIPYINAPGAISGSAGTNSGNYLTININGQLYKISLLNNA
jgi:hypothetical protein